MRGSNTNLVEADSANGYSGFLQVKAQQRRGEGFSPNWLPDFLFDFQRDLVAWSLESGRSAIFADCGMARRPCSSCGPRTSDAKRVAPS